MADDMTRSEPTIGEVYDYALEHGPVVLDGWLFTAWPELTRDRPLTEHREEPTL